MNYEKRNQFSNNNKKEIKRKKSYFWNTTTIDNENLSEKGNNGGNKFQVKYKLNKKSNCLNTTSTKENLFSRLIKKMNSVLSKSSNSSAGQRSENKVKNERNIIKHAQSMGEMQIINTKPQLKRNNSLHSTVVNSRNSYDEILPSLPFTLNDKIESNDWKTTLMNELDATRDGINKKNLFYSQNNNNSDSNELVINTLQPSCMDNNRNANRRNLAAMEEKLGTISKKTMINDWLHYNNSIPNSATTKTTDMPISSYLQHYHNQEIFSKKELVDKQERLSLLSAQLKKQGKKKHDHIKEKLDIAAARRNAIKTNRLREQMDTALFETMHLIRKNNSSKDNLLQQQDLEELFYHNSEKKGARKIYLSDATTSSSLSYNNNYLPINHNKENEQPLIW